MFLTESYLRMLKKVDKSWQEQVSPKTPRASRATRIRPRRLFRRSRDKLKSLSCSSESGHFSEDGSNLSSGYYGDDEVDRCTCRQKSCIAKRNSLVEDLKDYDIISIDFTNTRKVEPKVASNTVSDQLVRKPFVLDVDEYIIIPSTREEFCAGKFRSGTPGQNKMETTRFLHYPVGVTYNGSTTLEERKIVEKLTCNRTSNLQPLTEGCEIKQSLTIAISSSISVKGIGVDCCTKEDSKLCKSCTDESHISPKTFPVRKFPDLKSKTFNGANWWRDNIHWQIQQRNYTQTEHFAQLDTSRNCNRPRMKINRGVADYINRLTDFRPLSATNKPVGLADTDTEPLTKLDVITAIRAHGGRESELRVQSGSVAERANAFLKTRSGSIKELRESEDTEDGSTAAHVYRNASDSRRRTHSQTRMQARMYPWWRKSVYDQLKMRNLLECKYFIDAVVRERMSQSSEAPTHGRAHAHSIRYVDEYDIISDEDMTSLEMNKYSSQSTSQGYHSLPPNCQSRGNMGSLDNACILSF